MNESVFKAMSDKTRRRIIELLKKGPKTAGEISEYFSSAQPTISRHYERSQKREFGRGSAGRDFYYLQAQHNDFARMAFVAS